MTDTDSPPTPADTCPEGPRHEPAGPPARRLFRRFALAALLAALTAAGFGACTAPPEAPADAARVPVDAAAPPADINRAFLADDLDLQRWIDTFEGESREVVHARAGIVAALGLTPARSVADVGAGTGLFLQPLAAAVGPLGVVYEVDISPAFVAHLRQRVRDESLGQAVVLLGDERSARLPQGSVDAILVCDTYHHFEAPAEMLASLHAALRPGGRLVIVDFERIPGTSRDWVLEHVRCGSETVLAEARAAGFEFLGRPRLPELEENYVLVLRRP